MEETADTADKELACEENKREKENREKHETTPTISDPFMVSMKLGASLSSAPATYNNNNNNRQVKMMMMMKMMMVVIVMMIVVVMFTIGGRKRPDGSPSLQDVICGPDKIGFEGTPEPTPGLDSSHPSGLTSHTPGHHQPSLRIKSPHSHSDTKLQTVNSLAISRR